MTLSLLGTLPVSGVNIGLQASLSGLAAEVTKLTSDLSRVTVAVAAQVQVTANFPPTALTFGPAILASLSLPEITSRLNPSNFVTIGADLSADIALDLAAVEAQLAIVSPLVLSLQGGLDAAGISGWQYSGRLGGFAATLMGATAQGFGGLTAGDDIQAVVIATETFASWQALAEGVDVPAEETTAAEERLRAFGSRTGTDWNTGVADLFGRIRLLLLELQGKKTTLEASAQLALGLNLPDPQLVLDGSLSAFADLGIDGMLDNMVNVQTDLDATISGLQAQIDAVLALSTSITAQLSAGGLSVWTYSGPASALGSELAAALTSGLPGGSGLDAPVYALALAGTSPSMAAFGTIFTTA